jgi:hypothetical protein
MDKEQLITVVAAILTKDTTDKELLQAAVTAERLFEMVQSGKHRPPSDWDGKVKFI